MRRENAYISWKPGPISLIVLLLVGEKEKGGGVCVSEGQHAACMECLKGRQR